MTDTQTIEAICGAIIAAAAFGNNVIAWLNRRAIQRLHDCLDGHIAETAGHHALTDTHMAETAARAARDEAKETTHA